MFNSDGDLEDRISRAKAKAENISNGEYKTYEECIMVLRWSISSHRNIPLFSEYFQDRTLEELVFENELIRLGNRTEEERVQEIAENNPDEMQGLFDDWADEDLNAGKEISNDGWVDATPKTPVMSDEEFDAEARRFMETGEFKEP